MCKLAELEVPRCPTEIACLALRPAALFNVRSPRATEGVNSGYESVKACQVRYRDVSSQRIFSASTSAPPPSSFFHLPGRRSGFMTVRSATRPRRSKPTGGRIDAHRLGSGGVGRHACHSGCVALPGRQSCYRERFRLAGSPTRRSHHGSCRSALHIGDRPHPVHLEALRVAAKVRHFAADAGTRRKAKATVAGKTLSSDRSDCARCLCPA